ncbi:glucan endo-1,3-beta-glucosidase 7-like [Salvia hispanica]|uniref:glucan endo-1,3-beta-glucosidase 7-like n=1 Tax=Salvia hispanica TaxID=49212 RepID=UPI0020096D11|nr:glucan endo-1,3-beta-glucosidase 7-like [Salvia hispanica]
MAVLLLFLLLIFIFTFTPLSQSQSFLGVYYGQFADNLPPPESTANLLKSSAFQKVRLSGSDPAAIKALANTNIAITIGASNSDIPHLASDPTFAQKWIDTNVAPASNIVSINVGYEVLSYNDRNLRAQLLPAMQNLHTALESAGLAGEIKVSTVHSMAVLGRSDPPSSGSFDPAIEDLLRGVLSFNNATGSAFAINPYPYFAYRSDPSPETLAFCLFWPNSGRVDSGSKINYTNMFDAQVDGVRWALDRIGFKGVEIVVAETGWPYRGDEEEVGASVENAKAYNENLIAHLRSTIGTPMMPGRSVDIYLFSLYDENHKPGPTSERSFGLFKPDLTMAYDVGLIQTPAAAATLKPSKGRWCVGKAGVGDVKMQANLDYACGQGIDCSPIQPGGACFEPATVIAHANYAMNLFFHNSDKDPSITCDFAQTATLSSTDPSYDKCIYPSS